MEEIIKKWKIVGHRNKLEYLAKMLAANRLTHALLFCGPKHVGKFTIAKKYAESLICSKRNSCGECPNCRQISKKNHPDLLVLNQNPLTIDDIRRLISFAYRTPAQAKIKVIIIKEADNLTAEASNAFLKLLEEPPIDTVFILTAQNADSLLPTILSRCQIINFSLVDAATMNDDLLKLDYQKNIINKYAVHSQGCPGIFFDYCRQPDKLSALLEQEKELVEFLAWPIQQRLSFWESRLKNSRFDLGKHIDHWIYFIHQAISRQSSKGQLKPLENQSPNKLKENLQLLLLTKAAIRQSGNVRLNLENLSIQL